MKAWIFGAAAALFVATAAWAGGADEGNAGLDALNSGAYDEAIRHFTLALKPGPGGLTGDDREFAYFNRGKAYAAKGDYPHAIADFRLALRLKPDDDDAKAALQDALAQAGGGGAPVQRAEAPAAGGGDPWGVLGAMAAQQYYWFEEPGQDPHAAYSKVSWIAPQQALSVSIYTRRGQAFIAEYKLEARTGQLISAALQGGSPIYGTLRATPTSVTEYSFYGGKPLKAVEQRRADGSFVQVTQTYVAGAWGDPVTVTLAPTTLDELTADGLIKPPKQRK